MKGNIEEKILVEKRKELGSVFRDRREALGFSQQDLAARMGMHQSTISKIEDGKWSASLDMLNTFATHLNLKIELTEI